MGEGGAATTGAAGRRPTLRTMISPCLSETTKFSILRFRSAFLSSAVCAARGAAGAAAPPAMSKKSSPSFCGQWGGASRGGGEVDSTRLVEGGR